MPPKKNNRKKIRKTKSSHPKEKEFKEIEENLVFIDEPAAYFIKVVSFQSHFDAQREYRTKYLATIYKLISIDIEILPNARVKALTCAWARNDHEMAQCFLSMKKIFSFVEVSRAVSILDMRRSIRALHKKIQKLKQLAESNTITVNESTFTKLNRKIQKLEKSKVDFGSVSGALCRQIQKWTRELSSEELKFMAINFDTKHWRELADIIHFNSELDFPNLPWFLPYCYGKEAPEEITKVKNLNIENCNDIITQVPVSFHTASEYRGQLTSESKVAIVYSEDRVDRAICAYESLQCEEVDQAILERLNNEEHVDMGYGQLLERLMLLDSKKPVFYPKLLQTAELKLKDYHHNLDGPIAVFADASGSMQVAIKTATIISSFLTVFTQAKLVYFNSTAWSPPQMPSSIANVIELALNTKACNSTSPAAALWPFYEHKEFMKTIIVVTDEEENTPCHSLNFCQLFLKYQEEVGKCKLIFISFLEQHGRGQMFENLKKHGVTNVERYVFSRKRPDISKLDSIIGLMSLSNQMFDKELSGIEEMFENSESVVDRFNELSSR